MTEKSDWVSIADYASNRDCSARTVRNRIKSGCFKQNDEGLINGKEADANWNKFSKRARVSPEQVTPENAEQHSKLLEQKNDLMADRSRTERLKADKEEIKLAQLRDELINKKNILNMIESTSRRNADSWLSFAQEVSIELADEIGCDPDELYAHLDNAVRLHLQKAGKLEFKLDDT